MNKKQHKYLNRSVAAVLLFFIGVLIKHFPNNAPANIGQYGYAMQQQLKQNILSKLSRLLQTAIELLIEVEAILNPVMIEENTASYMGALYGTSSNSRMAAFYAIQIIAAN